MKCAGLSGFKCTASLEVRDSAEDTSQRMLNAIEPGAPRERICTDRIELSPNGPVMALNIPAGQWHTVQALESGTVILKMKNGKYEPISDVDILK